MLRRLFIGIPLIVVATIILILSLLCFAVGDGTTTTNTLAGFLFAISAILFVIGVRAYLAKPVKKSAVRTEYRRSKPSNHVDSDPEMLAEEERWNAFADDVRYMLAVYQRGNQRIVDVLEMNEANIEGKRKKRLTLTVAAPKVVKDKYLGTVLEWEKHFDLPREKLLYHEPLHKEFQDDDLKVYKRAVQRGMKKAKRL